MARIAKIDNAIKKRFRRIEKERSVGVRQKRVYFLIVCEGTKTEPNYFNAFKETLPIGTVFITNMAIIGTGKNTKSLVDFTIKHKSCSIKSYDKVWAVFDKDSFSDDLFNSAIIKAQTNGIDCAWSNEAFELWFLLHFQLIQNAMSREDYQSFFEREVKKVCGKDYEYKKNDPNTFKILQKYGDQEQAIKWAETLEDNHKDEKYATHNPCTKVHLLIKQLLNPQSALKE